MEPSCILGWVSFWQNTKIRLSCALVCFSQTQNLMLSPVLDFVDGPRILIDHLFWGLGPFFMIFKNWEEKGLFLQKFHLRLFTGAHLGEKPHPKTWRNLSEKEKILNYFLKEYFVVPAVHDPPLVVDQEGAVGDLLPETWIWWKVLLRVPASGNVTGIYLWGRKNGCNISRKRNFW